MPYFVVGLDGEKFGPVDVLTLNHWVQDGRVTPDSTLEDVSTGQQVLASSIPELDFPAISAVSQGNPQSNYPRDQIAAGIDEGAKDLETAWLFASTGIIGSIVFLFFCPIFSIINVLSIFGIVYSWKASRKGSPNTRGAMICSIIGLVLGILIVIGFFAIVGLD
ncbi:MAG: hypothetical protein WCI55_16820 [Armatimonadota bacterium]